MAWTFSYHDVHTVTSVNGQTWTMATIVPPPGLHPTLIRATNATAALSINQYVLRQDGPTNNNKQIMVVNVLVGNTTNSSTTVAAVDTNITGYHIQATSSSHSPAGYVVDSTVEVTWSDASTFCAYGTRPSAAAPAIAFVTDATIAAACALIGAPWLAGLFAPLIGYAIDTGQLCGQGPPTMPPITSDDLLEDASSRLSSLLATYWYSVCECVPGTPPPTAYVPPALTQPSDWPPAPTYTCNPADLCATLTLMLKRLDQLSVGLNNVNQLATLIQRYGTPFATVTSTVHAGLTGAGTFAISRVAGFRVAVTSLPPGRQLEGTPPYNWNVGWLSVADATHMLQEKRLSQTDFEWVVDGLQLADHFSYWLYPGVTMTVTELRAEP